MEITEFSGSERLAAPNTFAYRYLKYGDILGEIKWSDVHDDVEVQHVRTSDLINPETFTLDPGEDAISFFKSQESDELCRILDVLNTMLSRRDGGGFSVNSGMMRIDYERAHEDLNDIYEVVRFVDDEKSDSKCRHFSLYINSRNSLERLETINALIEIADFFALKQRSKNPDTRSVMHFNAPRKFLTISGALTLGLKLPET